MNLEFLFSQKNGTVGRWETKYFIGMAQVHHGSFIFIEILRFVDNFQLVFIERQVAITLLNHFRIQVAAIFVRDDRGDCGRKN